MIHNVVLVSAVQQSESVIHIHILFTLFGGSGGFPGGSDGKESTCNSGDPGLIPGLGRYPGERNVNPLQYSCLENSMGIQDKKAWRVPAHRVAEN